MSYKYKSRKSSVTLFHSEKVLTSFAAALQNSQRFIVKKQRHEDQATQLTGQG